MRTAARLAITLLIVTGVAIAAAAQGADLVFVNETGATVYYLYASPVTADTWGEDLLGATVFANGTRFRVSLRSAGPYDIRAVDSSDNEYIIWNWDARNDSRVVIHPRAIVGAHVRASDASALAWLNIVNRTTYAIRQIVVSPARSGSWEAGERLLDPSQMIYDGEGYRINVDVDAYDTFVYDIMLVDEDGDRYVKWDVNLELVGEVVYTVDDLEY